jgi:hypothetical protein
MTWVLRTVGVIKTGSEAVFRLPPPHVDCVLRQLLIEDLEVDTDSSILVESVQTANFVLVYECTPTPYFPSSSPEQTHLTALELGKMLLEMPCPLGCIVEVRLRASQTEDVKVSVTAVLHPHKEEKEKPPPEYHWALVPRDGGREPWRPR